MHSGKIILNKWKDSRPVYLSIPHSVTLFSQVMPSKPLSI